MRFAASPLCEHNPPRFVVAIRAFSTDGSRQKVGSDAVRLQRHLWAIAMEVQSARL
jgi:hypothetical protein